MGHKLSAQGLSPDQDKVKAITSLQPPTNAKEVRFFLGMITYCAKFIPNIATLAIPLRELTKKDTVWTWEKIHNDTIQTLQKILLSANTLAYFNTQSYTEIRTDASPTGLGAVLAQQQPDGTIRPITYASRSLTAVEQRYSQIEREALAILFAVERLRYYIYGTQFVIKTDHKPLITIFQPKSRPPPRIERWIMKLQPYNFTVIYLPGQENSADFLSRSNPLPHTERDHRMAEDHIAFISKHAIPTSFNETEIAIATNTDPMLGELKSAIISGNFSKDLARYLPLKHYLSIKNDVIMIQIKILIPESLRARTLQPAHEGHQGIVRTKERLRTKGWWPGIYKDVEMFIKSCHACQVITPSTNKTPLQPTPLPPHAWSVVSRDLFGPLPSGEYKLVYIDYYSHFPDISIINQTNSYTIVDILREVPAIVFLTLS